MLGPVDILINNAGVSQPSEPGAHDARGLGSEDVNANLNGAYNCAYAVLPGMKARRAGVIVNIGSVNGLAALGDAAYSAGKAGMISLTKSLALEFGRYDIRANIVCPGTVRTPLWDDRARAQPGCARRSSNAGIRSAASSSRSRSCAPSPFSPPTPHRRITGAVLPVDCGLTAGNIVMARELTLEDFCQGQIRLAGSSTSRARSQTQ